MGDNMKWHTEQRRISDLVPYEHNPRRLTDKQKTDLEKSLLKFDLAEIPAINTDNTILAGHMRLRILSGLGRSEETIDVRVPDHKLSAKDVQEYNIRSNKNTGDWDMDVLANAFDVDDLKAWGFDDNSLGVSAPTQQGASDGEDDGLSIKVAFVYLSPHDWQAWKNQIVNFLGEREIKFRVEE